MIQNLIDKLKEIKIQNSIKEFPWAIPSNCPLKIPKEVDGNYAQSIYLKENFHSIICNDTELKSHYWTIQNWGGIGSFKKNEKNDSRIKEFLVQLKKGKMTKNTHECISSLSKIASFIDSEKYAIYDSRVIYSLNWLLFNYAPSEPLFPQPNGRSADLAKYDMQTIFRLSGRRYSYRSHKVAFHDYCELLKIITPSIFSETRKIYMLEMLLFMIAPTWTSKDIEQNVSIEINIKDKQF